MSSTAHLSTTPAPRPPATASPAANERPRLDLSPSALVAGALAAITSAVLGAQLSTAGTIIGAGIGSLVGAVATSLYRLWLLRTHSVVKSLVGRRPSGNPSDANPAETPLPGLETPLAPATATATAAATAATAKAGPRFTPARLWAIAGIAASAAAAFALALVLITGFESARGTSLSGQEGTTIGVVARDSGSGSGTDAAPAATTASATPTPPPTATARPSTSASPTPAPSASVTPAAGGTATPAPTASATPTGQAATLTPAP